MPWLPVEFVHPVLVNLPTGHHLRPIRGDDVDIDYPAVMGSRERLWTMFGVEWEWPAATMTFDEDRRDLLRHEQEIAAHEAFNYCVLDEAETRLLGCIYIDPPQTYTPAGHDADVCWWVVDHMVETDLDQCLDDFVPAWLAATWPFGNPRVGLP
jgi:hypothetical protein